jgi:hypothetical protein
MLSSSPGGIRSPLIDFWQVATDWIAIVMKRLLSYNVLYHLELTEEEQKKVLEKVKEVVQISAQSRIYSRAFRFSPA